MFLLIWINGTECQKVNLSHLSHRTLVYSLDDEFIPGPVSLFSSLPDQFGCVWYAGIFEVKGEVQRRFTDNGLFEGVKKDYRMRACQPATSAYLCSIQRLSQATGSTSASYCLVFSWLRYDAMLIRYVCLHHSHTFHRRRVSGQRHNTLTTPTRFIFRSFVQDMHIIRYRQYLKTLVFKDFTHK